MIVGLLHKIAKNSLERPNIILAFIFFFLPFIFSIVARLAFGFPIDAPTLAVNAAIALGFWITSVALLFILIKLIKGAPSLKFTGLLTGQSFIHLFTFILSVFMLAVLLVLMPGFFHSMSEIVGDGSFTDAELQTVLSQLPLPSDDAFMGWIAILAASLIIFIGVFLMSVYLIYLLINFAGQGSRKQNWLVLILWLLIIGAFRFFALTI